MRDSRRRLAGWVAAALAVAAAAATRADDAPPREDGKSLKVVVHVNFADPDLQGRGLKNVENILKDAQGKADVEVVCHGPGIALLVKDQTKHAEQVAALMRQGVRFAACQNTMREKGLSPDELLPGATPVPSGAVEVIRKQQDGYAYFKP